MADKTIGQLPVAEGLGPDDLFIVEQNGKACCLPAGQIQISSGGGTPSGGDAGEILMKRSSSDNDVFWTKDASGLSVDIEKYVGNDKILGIDGANKFIASTVFCLFSTVNTDGYDKVRIKSMTIPMRGNGTVRFAVCSFVDGKIIVDAVLGDATAADGVAKLTLPEAYEAPVSAGLCAFADSANIGVMDIPGWVVNGWHFADNGVHTVSAGAELEAVEQVSYMIVAAVDAYAFHSYKTLGEMQDENMKRLTAIETLLAEVGIAENASF